MRNTKFSLYSFIVTVLLVHEAFSTSSANGCSNRSSKWKDIGGDFCYIIELNHKVTWMDAVYQCFSEGGSLASFHSTAEVQSIMDYVNDEGMRLYIGLRKNSNGDFDWVDKSALNFINWYPGEPNYQFEGCVEMYIESGKWNDIDCSTEFGYICSSPKTPTPRVARKVCPDTSSKWKDFGGEACYIIEKENRTTWDGALHRCTEEGGSLASFHSIGEISAVLQHTTDYHRAFHIGLRQDDHGTYEWADRSPVDLDFWDVPVDVYYWDFEELGNPEKKCVEMNAHNGQWSDVSCDKLSSYICSTVKEVVCGGEIVADKGVLQSPNYPNNYRPGEECVWNITVPENYRIFLNFITFDVDYSYNCRGDYVAIRDGSEATRSTWNKFCGSIVPDSILSPGNKMTVVFASDLSNEKTGFFAEFEKDICGGGIFSDAGVITSPNYPRSYRRNENCTWEITVPDDHQVILEFALFELEGGYSCDYDFVEVRDGHESDSSIMGRFCGENVPEVMRSSTNKVTVTFMSDDFDQRDGFILIFEKIPSTFQPVEALLREIPASFLRQKVGNVRSRIRLR